MYEIITQGTGYLATLFLGISLMVKDNLTFRWINAFGCLTFVIYGILIGAIPVAISNFLLLVINIYFLVKVYQTEDLFDLIEYKRDEKMIEKFMNFYSKEINEYFPEYSQDKNPNTIRFIVLRNLVIANIFEAEKGVEGIAEVRLNFTIPQYRDFKIEKFLLNFKREYLAEKGIYQLHYKNVTHKGHAKFLKVIGFSNNGREYFKDLRTD